MVPRSARIAFCGDQLKLTPTVSRQLADRRVGNEWAPGERSAKCVLDTLCRVKNCLLYPTHFEKWATVALLPTHLSAWAERSAWRAVRGRGSVAGHRGRVAGHRLRIARAVARTVARAVARLRVGPRHAWVRGRPDILDF